LYVEKHGAEDYLDAHQRVAFAERSSSAWVGHVGQTTRAEGFDLELAPETRAGPHRDLEGRTGQLAGRRGDRTDPRGRVRSLPAHEPHPLDRGVRPGHGRRRRRRHLRAPPHHPRTHSKVCSMGKLVFSPAIGPWSAGSTCAPVALKKGAHRLLVKSAHRDGAWYFLARFTPGARAHRPR